MKIKYLVLGLILIWMMTSIARNGMDIAFNMGAVSGSLTCLPN